MNQPPFKWPQSFSVAPAPRMTERTLFAMACAVAERSFDSIDELKAFFQSPEGREAIETSRPAAPLAKAQELAYDAWEAERPERYRLARQALAIDPRCGDAWLILAEEERSWRKQRRCFERAVEATERAAREEGGLEAAEVDEEGGSPGLYRRHLGLRAYVRARIALARCLADGGHTEEARALYDDLLARDREDPMGVRYEVLQLYHYSGDLAALKDLLARYKEDETCFMAYERLWLALAEGRPRREVNKFARVARKANPHVPEYLLEIEEGNLDTEYISLGGEDEAASYAAVAGDWWLEMPAAIDWLITEARRKLEALKKRGVSGETGSSRSSDHQVRREKRKRATAHSVYQMKVTLRGSKPPIWRRFLVRDDITLAELHNTLQVVMGWTNTHLYRFKIEGEKYGEPDPFDDWGPPVRDARKVKLRRVIDGEGSRFLYEYDFGDGWVHTVTVEAVLAPEVGAVYPVCLKGRRACPPEDCGGIWGYAELLEILADPAHPEYEERMKWLGRPFDPDAFDVDEVNEILRNPALFELDEGY